MPRIHRPGREEREVKLEPLVAPLRADVVSGASVIGRTAVEIVRWAVRSGDAKDTSAFRSMLAALCTAILDAQPAMAPLVAMSARVLGSFREEDPMETARAGVLQALEDFKGDLDRAALRIAAHAESLLHHGATVLTLSSSTTVRTALERHGRDRSLAVISLESRPMAEGTQLARHLSRSGLRVTVAVDAAAGVLLEEADLVLLGADSLGDEGIVNKIGSLSVATLARNKGIPVHVLMDSSKFLPPAFPQTVGDDRPGEEVMAGARRIRVWNRYFELLPVELIDGIVTEDGAASPAEAQAIRSRIPVPSELRAWAEVRRR
jgi:translation initiation factor 2B subunit (eIF-2B alpha/beta/delta family)